MNTYQQAYLNEPVAMAKQPHHIEFANYVINEMHNKMFNAKDIAEFIREIKNQMAQHYVNRIDTGKKEIEHMNKELEILREA